MGCEIWRDLAARSPFFLDFQNKGYSMGAGRGGSRTYLLSLPRGGVSAIHCGARLTRPSTHPYVGRRDSPVDSDRVDPFFFDSVSELRPLSKKPNRSTPSFHEAVSSDRIPAATYVSDRTHLPQTTYRKQPFPRSRLLLTFTALHFSVSALRGSCVRRDPKNHSLAQARQIRSHSFV